MMIEVTITCRGISKTAFRGKFRDAPLVIMKNMRSFDLKAIRKRMAFGAQDDRI
jgi:hypothetical protein